MTTNYDLCAGMVSDQMPHPMTALAKPALGATVVDAEFTTTIRRITAVTTTGIDAALVPMYTTISAWNADESRLILYAVSGGGHQLYDGKTYQLIKTLDINPVDVEQVYWDTTDPDILYYVDGQSFMRYHVNSRQQGQAARLRQSVRRLAADQRRRPDVHVVGLAPPRPDVRRQDVRLRLVRPTPCSARSRRRPAARRLRRSRPAAPSPTWRPARGQVLDATLTVVRSLGLQEPDNHASLGQLANGHDTWNGTVYDDGNDDAKSNVGILVTWDLTNGTGGAVIGPKTGYPYPPDGHVSAMAYRQPGWVFVSTFFVGGFDGTGTPPTPGAARPREPDRRHEHREGVPRRPPPELGQGEPRARVLGRGPHRAEPDRHTRRVRERLGRRVQRRQLRARVAGVQAVAARDYARSQSYVAATASRPPVVSGAP